MIEEVVPVPRPTVADMKAAPSRAWTWAWYRGRVRYELRWLPWSVKRVLHGSRAGTPLSGVSGIRSC
jgi:hypothetical protein